MKKLGTLATIIVTALVTDSLSTSIQNKKLKDKKQKSSDISRRHQLQYASNKIMNRERHGEYVANPDQMMIDLDFDLLIAREF